MRRHGNSDTPITMCTQKLFSKYHSSLNGTSLLREMAHSMTRAKKFPTSLGYLYLPESKRVFKNRDGDMSKKDTEASLRGSHWTNLRQFKH